MGDFDVNLAALETFAQTSDNRRSEFDGLHGTVLGAQLDSGAFGRIPGIGPRIHEAYAEHVRSCSEGIASAAEAMAAIASGVRAVAMNYQLADGDAQDGLATIHRQLDGVSIGGPR